MDYFLNENQEEIRALARRIAQEKVKPVAAKYDREGTFPWDLVEEFSKAGFFSVYIPEEYGGSGGGVLDLVIVTEELSRICGGIALAVAATALGTFPILLSGNAEQKARYLPDLVTGRKLAGFGLTEKKAIEQGIEFETYAFPYRGVGKAVAVDESEGLIKILYRRDTKEILGAHIAGKDATELIHEIMLAKKAKLLPKDIATTIHAHPTLSEGVMEAARGVEGWAIHV